MSLLAVDGVTKRFRGLVAVDNVSLAVEPGAIFAIIGPNGAGKTTLFNLIAGVFAPDVGRDHLRRRAYRWRRTGHICQLGIARTFQIVRPFPELTVIENAAIGAMLRAPDMDGAYARASEILRRARSLGQARAQGARAHTAGSQAARSRARAGDAA